MKVQIRYYKRFDADLLYLCEMGYNLNVLMKQALTSYANGVPFKIHIPSCEYHDLTTFKFLHSGFTLNDPKAVAMLSQIKSGYRNQFCKMILRDALVYQGLGVFFKKGECLANERGRLGKYDPSEDPSVCVAEKHTRRAAINRVLGDNARRVTNTKDAGIEKEAKDVKETASPKPDDRLGEPERDNTPEKAPAAAQEQTKHVLTEEEQGEILEKFNDMIKFT